MEVISWKGSKDNLIIFFQFLTTKPYIVFNINIYVSELIDIVRQIWFSSTECLSLISSVVELEPNAEVPF